MLKLYIDKGTRKMIDVSENEQDIIDTMGEYIREDNEARFLIIESNKDSDWIKARVIGYVDYVAYTKEYNNRLKEKTCVELKSNIVKNVKVKRLTK